LLLLLLLILLVLLQLLLLLLILLLLYLRTNKFRRSQINCEAKITAKKDTFQAIKNTTIDVPLKATDATVATKSSIF
jgi:hypothetical protein